jgi:DNA-binding PadR family transcriptional regulator
MRLLTIYRLAIERQSNFKETDNMRNFDRPMERPFDRRFGRGPGPGRPGRPFGAWDQVFPSGHFGPGPGRGRRGGGRRGRRGDVRAAILALLAEQPMHGYEMIQELDARTGGIWRPSPGSVYPTLQLLEDEGLVVGEQVEGRRRFTLTDAGREVATKAAERPPWADYADADAATEAHDLREAVGGILNALREVGVAGSDTQRAEALEVLKDTKRKLYAILAAEAAEADDEG